jgi:hypothetical protein
MAFDERPAGRKLLSEIASCEVVVIYTVDRLGRDAIEGAIAYRDLRKAGEVVFTSGSFDDSVEGKFTFQVFMAVAELERGIIARRMTRGKLHSVKQGNFVLPDAPYGYSKIDKHLVVRKDTAKAIKHIYKMYLDGNGTQAIANKLNDLEFPTPAEAGTSKRVNTMGWHKSRVRYILLSSTYKGEWVFTSQGETIIIEVPPIIGVDVWEKVQRLVEQRSTNGPNYKTPHVYLLQGRLFCGICSAHMSPYSRGGNRRYKCNRRSHWNKKPSIVRSHEKGRWDWDANDVEKVVKGFINSWMNNPLLLGPHVQARLAVHQEKLGEQLGEVGELERKLTELEAQENRVLELARRGVYEGDQMERELKTVRSERNLTRATLKKREAAAGKAADINAELIEMYQWVLEQMQTKGGELKWEPPTDELAWQKLIRYLIDRVVVVGTGKTTMDVRFQGMLVVPSLDEAANAPHIGDSRSR